MHLFPFFCLLTGVCIRLLVYSKGEHHDKSMAFDAETGTVEEGDRGKFGYPDWISQYKGTYAHGIQSDDEDRAEDGLTPYPQISGQAGAAYDQATPETKAPDSRVIPDKLGNHQTRVGIAPSWDYGKISSGS